MFIALLILGAILVLVPLGVVAARSRSAKGPPKATKKSAADATLLQPTGRVTIPPPPVLDGGDDEEVTEQTLAVVGNRPLLRKISGPPGSKGSYFLSVTGLTTIGRAPDNDIVLPEDATSSKHCRIEQQGNTFVLIDLGSTNKTWVKGVQKDRVVLRNGDQITIGDTTLVFALFGERK